MTTPDSLTVKLDELLALVENARSMPMSASCVVNRGEVVTLIEEVKALLPRALDTAHGLLSDREGVLEEGRAEAERIIAEAEAERDRLVSQHEVARTASVVAERVTAAARTRADAMQVEVDDYVDSKLANFEVVLTKTLQAVDRGREKLRGRAAHDDLRGLGEPDDALPLP